MENALQWFVLLAPGAFSALTASKFSGKEAKSVFALMEWVLYSVLDYALLSLATAMTTVTSEDGTMVRALEEGSVQRLAVSMLIALLVGILAAVVKQMQLHLLIQREGPGFLASRSPRVRAFFKGVFTLLCMAGILCAIIYPKYMAERARRAEAKYKEVCVSTYEGVRSQVVELLEEGIHPSAFGNLDVDGLTVKQVTGDQRWKKEGSGGIGYEAVYMVDGNGDLVYYSFRDGTHGTTWSGPSVDENFLNANGGWNGGLGSGWTGFKVN